MPFSSQWAMISRHHSSLAPSPTVLRISTPSTPLRAICLARRVTRDRLSASLSRSPLIMEPNRRADTRSPGGELVDHEGAVPRYHRKPGEKALQIGLPREFRDILDD